ncbi:MarR family transcriptional regulator [Novosphingobium sp.]|uniref:MarR family winged helix-turn-helix transcriptional regulator n=1 Tax=Novosphingobium sp. TaxID=1874826 RepID=UPI0031D77D56
MWQRVEAPKVDHCNCFALRKASRQISRFYDAQLQPTGLRITQFLTLAILNEIGATPIMDLADRLDIEKTAMGKMVTTLERDGLVGMHRSPTDGRSRIVTLTDAGRALFNQAVPLWHQAQNAFAAVNDIGAIAALRPGFVLKTAPKTTAPQPA